MIRPLYEKSSIIDGIFLSIQSQYPIALKPPPTTHGHKSRGTKIPSRHRSSRPQTNSESGKAIYVISDLKKQTPLQNS